jgi:hypothetical protein
LEVKSAGRIPIAVLASPLDAPSGDVDAPRLSTTEFDAGENLYANPLAT